MQFAFVCRHIFNSQGVSLLACEIQGEKSREKKEVHLTVNISIIMDRDMFIKIVS